jgi:tetratricopeptide (TPR) repeat protein
MDALKKNVLFTALTLLMFLAYSMVCFAAEWNNSPRSETNSPGNAAQLFAEGREAFEMGRMSDAGFYFDKAVQKDARFAAAWLYKALTAETDADRKINIYKAVLHQNNATEAERIMIDIELTYGDNNSEKRFQLAKQLAELHPENARALLMLAAEYQNRGETSKFRDLAHEAIHVEPGSPLGYRALAASWLLNEPIDFSLAKKYMQKFVELRPNEATAHIALGDVHRAALSLDMARISYSRAIEIDPQSAVALSKRGYIHTYQGRFEEARADFKKASELTGPMQHYSKPNGNIFSYLFSGNGKVAATDVVLISNNQKKNKSYTLNDVSDNCYFCCTFISMNHGFIASPQPLINASQCLRHEFDMESRIPDATAIEANIAFVEGFRAIHLEDYEKAQLIIEEYARTISPDLKPGKNEAHNFLKGLIYSGQGNYTKALASFKKSDTQNIFVKYNMGLVYDRLGMHEEAKEVLNEVAEINFANSRCSPMVKLADLWLKSHTDTSLAIK